MTHSDQTRFSNAMPTRPEDEPRNDDLARLLAELVGLNAILPPTTAQTTKLVDQD